MKNIENRTNLRKAEVAAEFVAAKKLAVRLGDYQSLATLEKEIQSCMHSVQPKEMSGFKKELNRLSSMTNHLVDIIFSTNGAGEYLKGAKVNHTAKTSMVGGVTSKDDLQIITRCGNSHKISLKMYKDIANVQVASGTWLSTLTGLAFEPIGRGSFVTPDGKKVSSKTGHGGNWQLLCDKLKEFYGPQVVACFENIKTQTKDVHKYRTEEHKPKDWTERCTKEAGKKVAPEFAKALQHICDRNPALFKHRILDRIGLTFSEGKDIVFLDAKRQYLSSFNDKEVRDWMVKINDTSAKLKMSPMGQSVKFFFTNGEEDLLEFNIPLTINSNGAWANKEGFHNKENMYLIEGQRRPIKSKQLDTSTNCWLNTPKTLIRKLP